MLIVLLSVAENIPAPPNAFITASYSAWPAVFLTRRSTRCPNRPTEATTIIISINVVTTGSMNVTLTLSLLPNSRLILVGCRREAVRRLQ